jgi:ligand-binding sensor domain-containing protein/anti-sigma regulatory factor (Ser/Thr protein kinase)
VKIIVTLLGYLLLSIALMAQYPYYHSITTEEGLPSNEVYSIVQDTDGFIWIGCDAGLVRYNGVSFKQFKNKAQKSRVMAGLVVSPSGRIYGTNFSNQIFYFENDSLRELNGWQGNVANISIDKEAKLWVSGLDGLFSYNEQDNTWSEPDTSITGVRGAIINSEGAVWFLNSKENKVGSIRNGSTQFYEVKHPTNINFNLATYYLFVGISGEWVISVANGDLYKRQGEAFLPFVSNNLNEVLVGRKYNHIREMPDGQLWFCSFSGIVVYNPDTDQAKVLFDGISFSNLLLDREHGLWLTTLNSGLMYVPDMRFKSWRSAFGAIPSNNATQLNLSDSVLYFATSDGYFGSMNLNEETTKCFFLGSRTDINGLYFDTPSQTLYFNSFSNLYSWCNNELVLHPIASPPVKAILRANDKLFYATSFGIYAADTILGDVSSRKLKELWARDLLYQEKENKVWVATDSGVVVIDASTERFDTFLLPGKQIIAISIDGNVPYALLYTGQIVAFGNYDKISVVANLPNNANGNDMEIAAGKILVATNQGLWIYHLAAKSWSQVDKTMGLASNNIKALKVYKNLVCLATGNGLQTLPLAFEYDKPLAKAYLSGLVVNGIAHDLDKLLRLEYKDVLSFVPEASAYSSLGKFQFAYRIVEADTTWQLLPATTQSFALPSISPGNFTFQLKAIDHLGRDSENIITLKGYMQPPFWQRWWFYLLLAATGVFLAFIGFRYRLSSIRRKQQQELERVQLENELELSQQAALKAQMNPHFIFNVLNSIKSYIYENDKKSATEYLSTFAKLIRRILAMSSEANVSLDEELDALALYIQLEGMLLEPPFEHSIKLQADIDTGNMHMPALLIQPFVENAFKHGLRHQKGIKKLEIAIMQLANGNLQITIEDNGVGRLAAERLNKDRMSGHQSFATAASSKRLALLNKNQAGSVDVVYIDKTNDSGLPTGTSVIITIRTT